MSGTTNMLVRARVASHRAHSHTPPHPAKAPPAYRVTFSWQIAGACSVPLVHSAGALVVYCVPLEVEHEVRGREQ